jgi:hypothetical protein
VAAAGSVAPRQAEAAEAESPLATERELEAVGGL